MIGENRALLVTNSKPLGTLPVKSSWLRVTFPVGASLMGDDHEWRMAESEILKQPPLWCEISSRIRCFAIRRES